MSFEDLIYILKRVLASPQVIGIGIIIVLYLSLVFFVARPAKHNDEVQIRVRRVKKPAAEPESSKAAPEPEEDE